MNAFNKITGIFTDDDVEEDDDDDDEQILCFKEGSIDLTRPGHELSGVVYHCLPHSN